MSSSTMRVAWLDQADFVGGAEYYALDLISGFLQASASKKTREEIEKFYLIGGKNPEYHSRLPNSIHLIDFNFPSVRGSIFAKIFALFRIFFAGIRLARILRKQEIKITFSNTPRTHLVMLVASVFTSVRWIAIVHDFSIPPFFLRKIARRTDKILSISKPCTEYVLSAFSSAATEKISRKISSLPNSFDFAIFPKPTPPKQFKKFLILGRIDPKKGQKEILEVAHLLHERNPDVQFDFIGSPVEVDGSTLEYAKVCEKFIADRQLQNVSWQQATDNPLSVINNCDGVIIASVVDEPFGRVVIEAMACGKMVFGFYQKGIESIYSQFFKECRDFSLEDFSPFFLVDPYDIMSLAEAIGYYADHPKHLLPLVDKFPEFARKNFSQETSLKIFAKILKT